MKLSNAVLNCKFVKYFIGIISMYYICRKLQCSNEYLDGCKPKISPVFVTLILTQETVMSICTLAPVAIPRYSSPEVVKDLLKD